MISQQRMLHRTTLWLLFTLLLFCASLPAQTPPQKRVLILFEGTNTPTNLAQGDARELAMLLGHFNVNYVIDGVESFDASSLNKFDVSFYLGYSATNAPPERFLREVYRTKKEFVWMNTGLERFAKSFDLAERFGIRFVGFDTTSGFDRVWSRKKTFTKGEPNINVVTTKGDEKATVLATAYSTRTKREVPYIVQSGNFTYIADSPFASADATDRYILFADMLHDLLGQPHEEIHRALLRIEDVGVFEDPARLRDIADLLSSKHVPFLVGVIPFFVDPGSSIRVSLSDKPEFVDALHYMVAHGATIVMHGITHQYEEVTATDYEFWDGSKDAPIKNDSRDYVRKKMKMGLEEFWKNNIYPLVWETPHYAASQLDYSVLNEFFTTAMEQRQVIDNRDYGQYFPYIIEHDLYGQRIIPENLGFIPFNDTTEREEEALQELLKGAEAQLSVRDGFASAFIHPFIDLKYIEGYIDGILDLGYTFMDVKNESSTVQLADRAAVTGTSSYEITLQDQYLRETWLSPKGEVDHWGISQNRIQGRFRKTVSVPEGETYLAEPSEYHEAQLTSTEKLLLQARRVWNGFFASEETFDEARVAIVWDAHAHRPAADELNDQASFVSAFGALNIPVDTLVGDSLGDLTPYNLLIVPYTSVEHLVNSDYDKITDFVSQGGRLITDTKSALSEELGVKFVGSSLKIERMRDHLYPEDALTVNQPEIMPRFDIERTDEILCSDEKTDAPVVIERKYGEGAFIYFGLRFDPRSTGGFTRFPYIGQYVQQYFHLKPIMRRENLELYFDPGFRRNVSIEDLVKRWADDGVRYIHAAGWHSYPTWTYDYARLIDLCHANGILVYAWLEPPMVSQKFWKAHPEWQELNYKGEPVAPQWRYLMALTSPACLAEVSSTYGQFLKDYDWDGVNLAELYFESDHGTATPRSYTPMHPSAREEFKRSAGWDPASLFDTSSAYFWKKNPHALRRFEDYRVEKGVKLHDEFLTVIDEARRSKPHLDVIVTTMDNLGNPELRPYLGVDVNRLLRLRKTHEFTLQVEDPQSTWSSDPRRYDALARRYKKVSALDTNIMVDLNILSFRDEKTPTQFPTLVQTGTECFQLVRSAALGCDRYAIYSESGIRPQDLHLMSYAASAPAFLRRNRSGWLISTPFPVVLSLPKDYSMLTAASGDHIMSDRGLYLIPAGTQLITATRGASGPFTKQVGGGRLLSISGNLTSLSTSFRSVTFAYSSEGRCAASFSHRPVTIFVDGEEWNSTILNGYKRFSVLLPAGEHKVIAVLETTVSYGIDITSYWSSWLIVGFGAISGSILFLFYVTVRISRPIKARP